MAKDGGLRIEVGWKTAFIVLSSLSFFSGGNFGPDLTGMGTPPNEMTGFVNDSVDMAVSDFKCLYEYLRSHVYTPF